MEDIPIIELNIQGGQLTREVAVAKHAPIFLLKELIEEAFDVKASRLTLHYNDQLLDNAQTVESYDLIGGATLNLSMTPLAGDPKFPINLKSESKNDIVKVKETWLVEDLKAKIGRHWAIPATAITLNYHDQEMKHGFALSSYLICEDSVVEVEVNIEPR